MANANPDLERDKRMENAIKAVEEGSSIRKAASKWGVPRSTVQDMCSGRTKRRAKRGFGLTVAEFLDSVKRFLDKDNRKTPFKENRPGRKWFRSFIKRNPQVRLRNARPLDKKRAKISAEDVDQWFTEYEKFILEKGLSNKPSQIWNCDESGFDLQGKAGKVLGPSAPKAQPYRVVTGTKEHITVLPCFNAAGQFIPPFILFAGKRLPVGYNPLEGAAPGSAFAVTEKGYMDAPTFYVWLANHFVPHLPPTRPVVLLVDSAEAHIDLHTFELAKKNNIYIYALLKNATHLLQPADVGLFGPLKQAWYKTVRRFTQQNPNTDITKKNFSLVFKTTWQNIMRPSILCDAFRKSGVYPLRKEQISDDQTRSSVVYSSYSATVTWKVVESHHHVRPAHVAEESAASPQSDQTVSCNAPPTPLAQESGQSVSLGQNLSPTESTCLLQSNQRGSCMASPAPLSHVSVESTSFDEEPIPLLEDSGYLSQTGQSISLEPSPSVSLGSGFIDAATTAFHAIESVLPTPVKAKYRRRDQEDYDLQGSPTYQAWKILNKAKSVAHNQPQATPSPTTHIRDPPPTTSVAYHQTPQAILSPPTRVRCLPTSPSSTVSPEIQEILTYPTAEERVNNNTKRKSVKRAIPCFMNSEAAMKLLLDEKLKKARDVAAKQKKLREKEEKREAKKREQEEKKRKIEEKKREKENKAPAKKRKVTKAKQDGRQWREELSATLRRENENICKLCLVNYDPSDDENMPWVQCDDCKGWMHICCVPISVDTTAIENNEPFFCHECAE